VGVQAIESRRNEQVKKLRQALARGERSPDGLLAIETFHLLEEALHSGLSVPQVFFTAEAEEQLLDILARHGAQPALYRLASRVFESVSPLPAAQGVAALVKPRCWAPQDLFRPAPALVIMIAGVQDPGNAGTIVRTAEAFGATGAILLRGSVHAENAKFLRATAGSAFRLPHLHGLRYGQALEVLRANKVRLYAAVPRARRTLDHVDVSGPLAMAIGAEGSGVPDPILAAAEHVSISHVRKVESLNAAVAAAIVLYHVARARAA
jgi:TrmH family RNA methyltransferase